MIFMQTPAGSVVTVAQAALQLAIEHYGAARHAEAEAVCRQILELAPGDPDTLNLLGLAVSARGNPLLGVSYLDQAIAVAPNNAAYCANRGEVLRRWGMLDAAAVSLHRSLEIDPNSAQALNNLGLVLIAQGKVTDASDCFERALEINPRYAEAEYELGCAYEQMDRLDLSAACCLRALERRPNFPEALLVLGNACLEQGDYAGAKAAYRGAVERNPQLPAARYQLSQSLLGEGDFANGWPLFESRYDVAFAGAVSAPLLPFRADWRWQTGREDTPWYPGMRLYRQPRAGDWASVIERVSGELLAL